jgi:hypothetical protein
MEKTTELTAVSATQVRSGSSPTKRWRLLPGVLCLLTNAIEVLGLNEKAFELYEGRRRDKVDWTVSTS